MFLCSERRRSARVLCARYFSDRIWFFTCRQCAGIAYQSTMGHRWDRSARPGQISTALICGGSVETGLWRSVDGRSAKRREANRLSCSRQVLKAHHGKFVNPSFCAGRHSATNAAVEQLKVGPLLGGFRCGTSIVSPRPSNATVTLPANRQATMASCVIGKSPKPKTTSPRSVFSASRDQERGRRGLLQPKLFAVGNLTGGSNLLHMHQGVAPLILA